MNRRGAFTLVEAVISIAVMGMLLVPAVQMIGTVAKTRGAVGGQRQGAQLAKELLDEIMQNFCVLPTGLTDGTTRQTWIVISDFNGWSENPPTARDGTLIPGWTGWKRSVLVEQVDPANPGGAAVVTDMGMRRITVKVTSPTNIVTNLTALRSTAGFTDRKPPTQITFPSWLDVTLDGGSGAKATAGVNLVNQVP
jgi:type II secretory pathway pseudopilin PulG